MKYKVAVSGWAVVSVEADSPEDVEGKVFEEYPGISGDLYDLEVHEVAPADKAFVFHTDLN